jgi:hypothetical protein
MSVLYDRSLPSWTASDFVSVPAAILKVIQSLIGDDTSVNNAAVFAFLLEAPSDFLNRNVRSLAIKRAYNIDASSPGQKSFKKLNAADRALIRRFMVKIIKDTEYIGPLVSAC